MNKPKVSRALPSVTVPSSPSNSSKCLSHDYDYVNRKISRLTGNTGQYDRGEVKQVERHPGVVGLWDVFLWPLCSPVCLVT
jgi:hypothetical protein